MKSNYCLKIGSDPYAFVKRERRILVRGEKV